MMFQWTERLEEQLILLVEQKPPLYNLVEKSNSNRLVKANCWREIGEKLNISDKDVLKKKWENLRRQYTRYMCQRPAWGPGSWGTTRQKWIVSRLRFLEPHTRRNVSSVSPEEELASLEDLPCGSVVKVKEEDQTEVTPQAESTTSDPAPDGASTSSGGASPPFKRSRTTRAAEKTTLDLMENISRTLDKMKDEKLEIVQSVQWIQRKYAEVPDHLRPKLERALHGVVYDFFDLHDLDNPDNKR